MEVITYYRLSKDQETSTSIERQQFSCRAYAQSRQWTIVEEFSDVDISAYRRGVQRPGFDAALSAIAQGQAKCLLFWKLDRLIRRARDFETVWHTCEQHGATLAAVEDPIDTSSPAGRLLARILASVAENESDMISQRIRSHLAHAATTGKPHKAGHRPFGLTADWARVEPAEAALVDEAVERTLRGDSLRSIVLDWRDRGIRSSTGKLWTPQALRHLLLSSRLSGQRSHHGKIVAEGTWPALVTPETSARLQAILTDPARRSAAHKHEWLLTGLLRCGKCGGAMTGGRWRETLRYQCPAPPQGCFGVVMKASQLDEHVVLALISCLDRKNIIRKARPRDVPEGELRRRVEAEERKRDQLAADFGNDLMTRAEWLAARAPVLARLDDARRALAAAQAPVERLGMLAGGEPVAAWNALSHDRKRAVLRAAIDRIEVAPAGRNRWVPTTERVAITWRV